MAGKAKTVNVSKMLGGLTAQQSKELAAQMNPMGMGKPPKKESTKKKASK
jgi:hypothetical protein